MVTKNPAKINGWVFDWIQPMVVYDRDSLNPKASLWGDAQNEFNNVL